MLKHKFKIRHYYKVYNVKKIKSVFQVVTLCLHVASSVLSDKRPARYLLIKEGMMSDIFQGKNTA